MATALPYQKYWEVSNNSSSKGRGEGNTHILAYAEAYKR